jgi:response regulator RpfG family c-di-GMP phosphodiesterase
MAKSRFLIVEDEEDLRELVVFQIENTFDCEVEESNSGMEAIEKLKSGRHFDFLICDYNMPNGNGGDVFRYLASIQSKIHYILLSSDLPEQHPEFKTHPMAGFAEKPFFSEVLEKIIYEKLKEGSDVNGTPAPIAHPTETKENLYGPVPIRVFFRSGQVPCDVFIRLSDQKFVKVLNSGEVFGDEELNRFSEKKVYKLFIPKDSLPSLLSKMTNEWLTSDNIRQQTNVAPLSVSSEIQEVMQMLGSTFGYSEDLEKLAKANVAVANSIISKNKTLNDLLKQLHASGDKYLCEHGVVVAFIASGIAKGMKWGSESTLMKIALAASLHDVSLASSELVGRRTLNEVKRAASEVGQVMVDQMLNHPSQSAKIVAQFKEIPPDVDVIVEQHHELPDGTGYPLGIDHQKISPLSAIFIIAHDIYDVFIVKNKTPDLHAFVESRRKIYSHGVFKKILQAILLEASTQAQ